VRRVFLLLKDARGATAIEYCLIVAGIAIVIAIAVFSTGGSLTAVFVAIEHAVGGISV
jgi:Flp pilus assembly pilin Flp